MAFTIGTLQDLKKKKKSIYIQRALNFKRFFKKPRASQCKEEDKLLGSLNEVRMLPRRWQADAKFLPRGTESSEPFKCQETHHFLPLITPKTLQEKVLFPSTVASQQH